MAVAVGFEPTEELPPHTLSRRAPSAARTRHRRRDYLIRRTSPNRAGPERIHEAATALVSKHARSPPQVDGSGDDHARRPKASPPRPSRHSTRQRPAAQYEQARCAGTHRAWLQASRRACSHQGATFASLLRSRPQRQYLCVRRRVPDASRRLCAAANDFTVGNDDCTDGHVIGVGSRTCFIEGNRMNEASTLGGHLCDECHRCFVLLGETKCSAS